MTQDNSIDNVEVEIRRSYYESGALYSEAPYENGKKHGIAKHYYESGALYWETTFVNGEMHGIEKWYYASGTLWGEIPYVNGGRHGIAKRYDKDKTNIKYLVLYKEDREVASIDI